MITRLRVLNPQLNLFPIEDSNFLRYGQVIKGYDLQQIIEEMENTPVPKEGNIYVPSHDKLEKLPLMEQIKGNLYGGMEIQIGYCNGQNSRLGGLEYHKSSEINIAATDMLLLLGDKRDIKGNTFTSDKVEGFFVPKGVAVELYQTTLHFAPCKVQQEGFKAVVILPKGTNTDMEKPSTTITQEDKLLFKKNKWLLAHPENKNLMEKGAFPGILGENYTIYF